MSKPHSFFRSDEVALLLRSLSGSHQSGGGALLSASITLRLLAKLVSQHRMYAL